nr:MAG TPA: hypothetical protein [Caudoviricetes sp.]
MSVRYPFYSNLRMCIIPSLLPVRRPGLRVCTKFYLRHTLVHLGCRL